MTAKQILDAFSESLMQDDRILSPRERELLTSLLQNAKAASGGNPEIQCRVTAAIARSVGETVAQRAFALLGSNIVEQLVAPDRPSPGGEETLPAIMRDIPSPAPPTVRKPPTKPPSSPSPPKGPEPTHPPQPHPPAGIPDTQDHALSPRSVQQRTNATLMDSVNSSVGVLDTPAVLGEQCVVLDEFLAPQELDDLIRYALQRETEFKSSQVFSPSGDSDVVDYDHRRSRVLIDLGPQEEIILDRVRRVLPRVLERLGLEDFPITHTEAEITASNDGDFFRAHCDDAQEVIASRRMTFVYFFHREPRCFEGGELRLHDSGGHDSRWQDSRRNGPQSRYASSYQTIIPQQNQIVFFPCSVLHEITPVRCPSRAFADSRFTFNGWLHK